MSLSLFLIKKKKQYIKSRQIEENSNRAYHLILNPMQTLPITDILQISYLSYQINSISNKRVLVVVSCQSWMVLFQSRSRGRDHHLLQC